MRKKNITECSSLYSKLLIIENSGYRRGNTHRLQRLHIFQPKHSFSLFSSTCFKCYIMKDHKFYIWHDKEGAKESKTLRKWRKKRKMKNAIILKPVAVHCAAPSLLYISSYFGGWIVPSDREPKKKAKKNILFCNL